MYRTILLTETHTTSTLSANIALYKFPSWKTFQIPRIKTLPLTMLLQLPMLHYSTRNSPWTPSYLLLQENIVMHMNWPDILNTPSGNEPEIYCHTTSVRKCTNKTSNMELHQKYPLLNHQFFTLSIAPPTNNINTHYQPETIRLCKHPNHLLTHLKVQHQSHQLMINQKIFRNSYQNLTT